MIKIIGIIIISLIVIIFLKRTNGSFALLVTICAGIIILSIISSDLFKIIDNLTALSNQIGVIQPFVNIMLKALGLSLLAQFVGDLCRDSGEITLANQTEIASKVVILITILPLFDAVLDIVTGLLK